MTTQRDEDLPRRPIRLASSAIGVVTEPIFEIVRGIKQGCPSSGSVWALIFGLFVRLLRERMSGPRDEPSLVADDSGNAS